MEYTAQQAAEAARNIGVDLEGEKIRPEALAAGMAVEAARHGTKDAATNIVAEDPVIAAKLALANLRVSPNYYSPKAGVTAWEKSLARGAKQQGRKTEYKTLLFNVDDYDEEQGIFSGYGSVFGNVDDGGDIVEPEPSRRPSPKDLSELRYSRYTTTASSPSDAHLKSERTARPLHQGQNQRHRDGARRQGAAERRRPQ